MAGMFSHGDFDITLLAVLRESIRAVACSGERFIHDVLET